MMNKMHSEYEIVENKLSRAKSDVWEKFGVLQDLETNFVSGSVHRSLYQRPELDLEMIMGNGSGNGLLC